MPTTELPPLDVNRTLGELVAERPGRARVLERVGLDYCCKGHRSLADASAAAGLDPASIAEQMAAVDDADRPGGDDLEPVALVDHILETHHAYLHEELPLLDALAEKVRDAHRSRHPELDAVARAFNALRLDLEPHLAKEEQVLFPAIRAQADGETSFPFGAIGNPIRVMLGEHERAGEMLAELRAAAGDYAIPDDACTSYRLLYERLEHLESDTFRHIHLENNVLFPAVADDLR